MKKSKKLETLDLMELAYDVYCAWLKKLDKETFTAEEFEQAENKTMEMFKDLLRNKEQETIDYIKVRSEREHNRGC